jgi:cyclopropane fatty-acyl-phospholipid synthase-like methyltransferase
MVYRTNASQAEITELYDERFFRMWQFYLAGRGSGVPLWRAWSTGSSNI